MKVTTEAEMRALGSELSQNLDLTRPQIIELVGDVGAGKTTLTGGLAAALGVVEAVTSPSFTISKRYAFVRNGSTYNLVHYDFYRLGDPGLMQEDLLESLTAPGTVTVVEWADSVDDILPSDRTVVKITTLDDGNREVNITRANVEISGENAAKSARETTTPEKSVAKSAEKVTPAEDAE